MLARSKLNSIEAFISQALKNFEISHEIFKTIMKKRITEDFTLVHLRNKKRY